MAENIKMTRIADLGEAPSHSFNAIGTNGYPQQSNDYMTMNVHANPYGIPPPSNHSMPPPISRPPSQNQSQQYPLPPSLPSQPNNMEMDLQIQSSPQYVMPPEQLAMIQQQMLPSRDIPQNTAQHIQDEQIRVNYIPPPKTSEDYVKEYDKQMEHKLREYEKEKRNQNKIEKTLDKFQTPIIAAILFFILHMPIINTVVFKRFAFLSIYNDDGNFNIYGLILKSAMFGSIFWTVENVFDYLASI